MPLLLDRAGLEARRPVAAEALAPLASGLASELDRLLPGEEVFLPPEKAKLSRRGGRCPRDGEWLEFDPGSPRRHRCPRCGKEYDDDAHYRWWIMGYQLWLAERAVHGATLAALGGEARYRRLAERILQRLADRYLSYPNADNVLGPTRLFFSTYLESIWLLQVCIALDLLETIDGSAPSALGKHVRAMLIDPSARLIASFNEGLSNRQVWNNAALLACGGLLDRSDLVDRALGDGSGLREHLRRGLLSDGTWYEGENYHLFAHRGLWYLVTMAARLGAAVPDELVRRFDEGFVTPFLTALPDFTFPARRDAPYRVSLRQWRVAESCELGLARHPDEERLASARAAIYREDVPPGDAARWRSTAEAERNVPGVRITRADLGWKSLLFARPTLPVAINTAFDSALLGDQGFAVLRRDSGRVYVALDYGHSGGGHGHPDRLNLWLVNRDEHVLEDVGTGSYVDPSLNWYRSTLAHNAPLVDGRSQPRVDGRLRAWDERGDVGWIDAQLPIAPGVVVRRAVIATETYLVDLVEWEADRSIRLDLPFHVEAELQGVKAWHKAALPGEAGLEDGFSFIERAERAGAMPRAKLVARGASAWICIEDQHEWWRCIAPGPPGHPLRPFLLVRCPGKWGSIVSVWAFGEQLPDVQWAGDALRLTRHDGSIHDHYLEKNAWRIHMRSRTAPREVRLDGSRGEPLSPAASSPDQPITARAPAVVPRFSRPPKDVGTLTAGLAAAPTEAPLRMHLGRDHYRRSEDSWEEAGRPEALVAVAATDHDVHVEVSVKKHDLVLAPPRDDNDLDNEHPDINSDGLQLYARNADGRGPPAHHSWILVPQANGGVRVTERMREGPPVAIAASWRRTFQGYQVLVRIPRAAFGGRDATRMGLDVIVNEIVTGRERRRGQLVLSGAKNEWTYLAGDRHDPDRYIPFSVANG